MDRVFEYRVKKEDLQDTAGGILGKLLKIHMGFTAHEISHVKFTDGGISVLRKRSPAGEYIQAAVKDRVDEGDVVRVIFRKTKELRTGLFQ